MPEGDAAVFQFQGMELTVRETATGWHVRWGEREAESRYLDHAVADTLGWHRRGVLNLVGQILAAHPAAS